MENSKNTVNYNKNSQLLFFVGNKYHNVKCFSLKVVFSNRKKKSITFREIRAGFKRNVRGDFSITKHAHKKGIS